MKYESILDTIGRTPVVQLKKLAPPRVTLYAKVESFNPMGSIKDRFARAVIERAEASGDLKPGQTVVEATSGNTGIGLAMVCAQKGYPLVIVMAENFSIERRRLMRFLGARVVLTPAAQKGSGMLAKAIELAEAHGWYLSRQFENEANPDIHSETTAREILDDFAGERLDFWVSTFGTGGTVKGVARTLKAERPETRIVVTEPDNSPMLGSGVSQPGGIGGVPGTHPSFRPHPIQGTSPDFIAQLMSDALTARTVDHVEPVNGAEAMRTARDLATREGIFAGISSGASVAAALRVARDAPAGSTILCMLPDTGERYLSTPLFDDVGADMNSEEDAISNSTPLCRFGVPVSPAPAPQPVQIPVELVRDVEAERLVGEVLSDSSQPVVMFALEWCEFCWSARRLLEAMEVRYRSIDLDSVAYQSDDLGGRIRKVLNARTGIATIPQIFVGGKLVGGATDLIGAAQARSLHDLLKQVGLEFTELAVPPQDFLPKWLKQARAR
ncbi:MAG: cysteine synthase A [Hyphomonas sp.]|nr:cysteine synthase A [Hyphomonas sp.]